MTSTRSLLLALAALAVPLASASAAEARLVSAIATVSANASGVSSHGGRSVSGVCLVAMELGSLSR